MLNSTLKEKIKKLPPNSGIYIFKDSRHKPIYVGKASNLKNRLNSYLKTDDHRIKKMIDSANILKFIETESDIEALILESQLIKKFRPQFNIVMRDDKQYFYVGFSNENFPKIFITHQPTILKSKSASSDFIGPFTDGSALKTTLRFLRSVFPYCTCTQSHHNYCLNYHIGKCLGFCCLKSGPSGKDRKNYLNNIKSIEKILSGKKNSFVKELRKEAGDFAKKDNFEKAIELRDKITKLERIFKNAKIIKNSDILKAHRSELGSLLKMSKPIIKIEGYDVSNIQGLHATGSMVAFVHGLPNKNLYRKFKIQTKNTPDDTAMLKEVLERRFKHSEWPFPDLILIDGGKGQVNIAINVLKKMSIKIQIIGISKNERHVGHQLIIPGRKTPLPLTKLSPADRSLLLAIDSEAHRFAINYYRERHRRFFQID